MSARPILYAIRRLPSIHSILNRRQIHSSMPPTFDNVRQCLAPIWKVEEFKRDILWAGVFGSVARNRARKDSDVDVLIVLKEHLHRGEPVDLRERLAEACGREVSLVCIWQGVDWAWGMIRVEALLSSRTVYGKREDIEHLRQDSMTILKDGLIRFNNVANAVEKLKECVTAAQTFETFIQPSQQSAREKCILQLGQIAELIDIQPLHHPLRSILIYYVFDQVDQIRTLLAPTKLNVTSSDAQIWRPIWDCLQPTSLTMFCIDSGFAVYGPKYIRHVLASKRLAVSFEETGKADADMYNDILR